MSSVNESPLVAVLLRVAQAAPRPWYFRQGLKKTPENEEYVDHIIDVLEDLYHDGLVYRESGTSTTGPGVLLTTKGRQVVMDPEARKKLAESAGADRSGGRLIHMYGDTTWEEALNPDKGPAQGQRGTDVLPGETERLDPAGDEVRASIQLDLVPWVTRGLVFANVALFLFGAWLAYRNQFLEAYLMGGSSDAETNLRIAKLLHHLGSLNGSDLLAGGWWRMLTSAFLHGGVMHLLMNMWALWNIGAFVERIFGRWRMFVIYFLGAWGCSCMAMAMTPGEPIGSLHDWVFRSFVGASGAVCALLGALGAWTLLVSHHLPKEMASSLRTQLMVNILLLGIMSFMPGISAWGHLGGGIAGALAALALHYGRFGPPLLRPMGYASLFVIAGLGLWLLQAQRGTNEQWALIESERYFKDLNKPGEDADKKATEAYEGLDWFFENVHPTRVEFEKERAEKAIDGMKAPMENLEGLIERLSSPWPYQSNAVREAMAAEKRSLTAKLELCRTGIRCLERKGGWTREDTKELGKRIEEANAEFDRWEAAIKGLPTVRKYVAERQKQRRRKQENEDE
jgi:membrane associated rhomboid family serine protease